MSEFDSPKFKRLRDQWYKRARSSGLTDIEEQKTDSKGKIHDTLKTWDSFRFCVRAGKCDLESIETYYRLAGQFLYSHEFQSTTHRIIWELHSDGKGTREISTKTGTPLSQVQKIIQTLKAICLKNET